MLKLLIGLSFAVCLCLRVKNGFTALHTSAKKNLLDIATTLLDHGAQPNAQSAVSNYNELLFSSLIDDLISFHN